jgi:hypothetical protein
MLQLFLTLRLMNNLKGITGNQNNWFTTRFFCVHNLKLNFHNPVVGPHWTSIQRLTQISSKKKISLWTWKQVEFALDFHLVLSKAAWKNLWAFLVECSIIINETISMNLKMGCQKLPFLLALHGSNAPSLERRETKACAH